MKTGSRLALLVGYAAPSLTVCSDQDFCSAGRQTGARYAPSSCPAGG